MSDRLKTPALPLVRPHDEDEPAVVRAHIPLVEATQKVPTRPFGSAHDTVRMMAAVLPLNTDRATVTVVQGVNAGQVFTIEGTSAVVGRGSEADFFIDDPAISRSHCRFRLSDDRVFVEDLGSANGTFVSGRRLRDQQLSELFAGDRVQVGPNVLLRFSLSDRAEEQLQRRLYETATRDSLTGVFTHAYLNERLLIETASALRHGSELSLLILSVDRWADTVARLGGAAGARLVKAVGAKLAASIRIDDVLGRFGRDRFAVVVRASNTLGASVLAERLRAAVAELSSTATLSIGVASLEEICRRGARLPDHLGTGTERDLVALAEARVAEAIREGGNRTQAAIPDVAAVRAAR
ncbi:MAG: diguanylate cyclase [Deltaproteobacteria bacterium]|nr:diguanylate cyclase [Deltaproteobacteria bacterium]